MSDTAVFSILHDRLGARIDAFLVPPPVFTAMQGEFLEFTEEAGILSARFPILKEYLNPYGTMQGGMIAAAIDNTIGPLSMLVAPPNVTRHMELKYSQPVTPELVHVIVEAKFLGQEGRQLKFTAKVYNPDGKILAIATAIHWIIASSQD